MMASHRPSESPPPPPPPPEAVAPAPAAPGGKTTLAPSNFIVGFDWVLAFGVMALAFLLASFSVRNSDFWMHLATGRLLAEGNYSFGKDPFSFVGEDRTWVNHAWLFDWLLYLLYKAGGGPAVVIAKAVALALTAGLLLLARKPGQSVFPGVVCVGLALVASAPRLLLQPTAASFLFLAALMFLLIRFPRRRGSWTFPAVVAGVFCLWANCDQWFFLGPAALALYTLGQYIRPDEGEDPGTLLKALGLGVVACMLNPHHVQVWAVPVELWDVRMAEVIKTDRDLATVVRGGLDREAWDFDANPANPSALIALLVLSVAGFALNYRRGSVGLALVFLGAVGLTLAYLRAVPFLAFVAAPVAAVNVAEGGRRLGARPLSEGAVRLMHTFRGTGRAVAGLVGLILIALTYAGWLHPFTQQRRWKWDVEPDASLVRASERIQKWRNDKLLPPEARLLNVQPDAANYLAWFAPGEKSFFDSRLGFHGPEVADYIALRRHLGPQLGSARHQEPFDLTGFLHKHRITYAITASANRLWNQTALDVLWGADLAAGVKSEPEWVLWQVDGRAAILGWTRQEAIPSAAFEQLKFDPLRAAYAEATPLRVPDLRPPLPPRDIWERFIVAPPSPPPEGDESFVLMRYRESVVRRAQVRHRVAMVGVNLATLEAFRRYGVVPVLNQWTARYMPNLFPPIHFYPPEAAAVAVLGVRAARRAIISSPDHPDGYYFLAKAYTDSAYLVFPDIQETVITASLARCVARLPEDPSRRRATFNVQDACFLLDRAHEQAVPPRLDLKLHALKLATEYLRFEADDLETLLDRPELQEERERGERQVDDMRRLLKDRERSIELAEADLRKATDKYVNEAARQSSPLDRAAIARRFGVVKEGINELYKAHQLFQKQLENESERKQFTPAELALQLAVHAELIEQMLYAGRAEEAGQILDTVDAPDAVGVMASEAVRREYFAVRVRARGLMFGDPRVPPSPYDDDPAAHFRNLREAVALSLGDYKGATDAMGREAQILRRELTAFRDLNFPGGPPKSSALPGNWERQIDLFFRPVFDPLQPMAAQLLGFARLSYLAKVDRYRQLANAQIKEHTRLALTHLEQGDMWAAAHHFQQVLIAPDLPAVAPAQRLAREYLRAMGRPLPPEGPGK
jgi:hypothetical protein